MGNKIEDQITALTPEQIKIIQDIEFSSLHNHTTSSNIRLLDCINKPEELIDRAIELDYSAVAITDHETLAALPESLWYVDKLKKEKKCPESFKFILGNEAYVVNSLEKTKENYKAYKNGFYHLVLLAKDYEGYEQLKVLSTAAWESSYISKRMTRVPLEKSTLYKIVSQNKGHLICSSACLGNELSRILLQRNAYAQDIRKYKKILQDKSKLTKLSLENFSNEYEEAVKNYNSIQEDLEEYFNFYLNLFKDDFYLELQPSNQPDQVYVNKELIKLGKKLNIKWIITTDSHYKSLNDRKVHKAYLKSKDGEREIDDFYATTYLMDKEEIVNYLINNQISFEDAVLALSNTKEIYDKCEYYTLEKGYQIPKINVSEKLNKLKNDEDILDLVSNINLDNYESIKEFLSTDNEQDCYYVYSSLKGLIDKEIKEKGKSSIKVYIDDKENLLKPLPTVKYSLNDALKRINSECEELFEISKELNASLSQYYISMQQIIDLVWTDGDSFVGPGRGSVGCWYTAYLMDITDTNAMEWSLPQWRLTLLTSLYCEVQ